MSEFPPPGGPENPVLHPAVALTDQAIGAVLAEFQGWLTALRLTDHSGPNSNESVPLTAPSATLDLHTLLSQFLALRHEVNLQTRASRVQQEQNASALVQLSQALESLQSANQAKRQQEQQNQEEILRPVLKTLVDLYDALALAAREVQRMQEGVLPVLKTLADTLAQPPQDHDETPPPPRSSFLSRLLGGSAAPAPAPAPVNPAKEESAQRAQQAREASERSRQMLGSLIAGYTMGLQRVERALLQHGLEPMAVVGAVFDPEAMEVVDTALDSGRPTGEVVQEVRRGYFWNGRVFRYAQVCVAKS
jgi:molecular chaperone GrpE